MALTLRRGGAGPGPSVRQAHCKRQAQDKLFEHAPDEQRIADEVPFSESAGRDEEPSQLFQAVGAGRRVIQRGARWSSPEMYVKATLASMRLP